MGIFGNNSNNNGPTGPNPFDLTQVGDPAGAYPDSDGSWDIIPADVQPISDDQVANDLAAFVDDLVEGDSESSVMAAETKAAVEADHRIITATASAIDPQTVRANIIGLMGLMLDSSASVAGLLHLLGLGTDTFTQALYASENDGVQILQSATRLDGRVVYPFTPIREVPLFGREPMSYETPLPTGLMYDLTHMRQVFPVGGNTPLYDRLRNLIISLLAEQEKWEDPRSNRQVNLTALAVTDGINMGSTMSIARFREYLEEVTDTGNLTVAIMYIGEMPDFGSDKYAYEIMRMRRVFTREMDTLPDGSEKFSLEAWLYAYFGEMGIPSNQVFLPGTDARKIRKAVGQASRLAIQSSGGALRR